MNKNKYEARKARNSPDHASAHAAIFARRRLLPRQKLPHSLKKQPRIGGGRKAAPSQAEPLGRSLGRPRPKTVQHHVGGGTSCARRARLSLLFLSVQPRTQQPRRARVAQRSAEPQPRREKGAGRAAARGRAKRNFTGQRLGTSRAQRALAARSPGAALLIRREGARATVAAAQLPVTLFAPRAPRRARTGANQAQHACARRREPEHAEVSAHAGGAELN